MLYSRLSSLSVFPASATVRRATVGLMALSRLLSACEAPAPPRLRTLGNTDMVAGPNGRVDTVWAPIPQFSLTDQLGRPFTNATVRGKIVVADFFFASCPTICPVVKKEELRLWEKYKADPRVVFVSHTIDPRHDSVAVLRDYADRLGVAGSNWYFVTGPKDTIYALAQRYLVAAQATPGVGGGFTHSGALALVDPRGHLRASFSAGSDSIAPAPVYDGTRAADVDRLIGDVGRLLAEEFPSRK